MFIFFIISSLYYDIDTYKDMSKPEIFSGAKSWCVGGICFLLSTIVFANNGQDTIAPILTSPAFTETTTCSLSDIDEFEAWYLNAGGATATDNSDTFNFIGIPDLTTSKIQFLDSSDTLCGNTKAVTVTFFAQDTCGNSSIDSTIASFFTIDTLRPFLIEEAQSQMLACGPGIRDSLDLFIRSAGNAVASDNCADSISLTNYFWNDSNGNGGVGLINEGSQIPLSRASCDWSVMVSFLLSDGCGNIIATTASFAIIDTIPPILDTFPPDVTVQCDQVPANTVSAFDDCDLSLSLSFTEATTQSADSLSCDFYNYTITRNWSAVDACDNMVTHNQTITVVDTLVPSFTNPPDLSIDCVDVDNLDIALGPIGLLEPCGIASATYIDTVMGSGCSFELKRTWIVEDPCGNDSSFVQILTVTDSTGPSLTLEAQDVRLACDSGANFEQAFSNWLLEMGGSEVVDQCGNFDMFAAVPGSYLLEDTSSYPGVFPSVFSSLSCNAFRAGVIDSMLVDFVYFDECGNTSLSSASFVIIDTIAPIFMEIVNDTILSTSMDCSASYDIIFPDFVDACLFDQTRYDQMITRNITSETPGSNDAVVDTVLLNFNTTNSFINPTVGNISLIINLDNLDTDDPDEFFILVAEDNTVLDSSIITSSQCSDQIMTISSLSTTQINNWAQDGTIEFRLIPNVTSGGAVFSINDVCDFSLITASLGYDVQPSNSPQKTIVVDGVLMDADSLSSIILGQGFHTIDYQIVDCGGNLANLSQMIEVIDQSPPQIICPLDTVLYVSDSLCNVIYDLPLDISITDNCGGSTTINRSSPELVNDRLIRFVPNLTLGTEIASNRQFIFDSIAPINNSQVAPQIEVFIKGDINDIGEFYSILGEDGSTMAVTAVATNQTCGTTITTTSLSVSIEQFNNWASDSILILSAVSNIDPSVDGGGINPCGILPQGQDTDGISELWATLSYDDYDLQYEVDGSTQIAKTVLSDHPDSTGIQLLLGSSTIQIFAEDESGNVDSCTYEVSILDTISPIVNCTDFVAFVHPSGLIDYQLSFDSLDTGSSDNCMLVDTLLSQEIFTCNDVGNEFNVTISLEDQSNNRDSCIATIRVEMAVLMPSFTTGVCEDDTLKLFANVPEAPIANAYTFSWSGPNGFVSSLENPFILNADDSYSGTYILEVTGFNGCLSSGTVVVNVEQLVTPSVTPNAAQVCVDDEVLLTTNSFSGDLMYKWYEGQFPNGVLLQTTQNASLVLSPTVGDHFYYVIIESSNCITNASASIMVSVLDPPVATVIEPFITICEGSDLSFGTDNFNPFYEYFWSGPDDYESSGQFPEIIENIDIDQQGAYSLVIKFGSCISDTANTQVVIFDKPIQPQITSDGLFCEGSTIVMTVNNLTDGDQYTWFNNGQVFTNTSVNTLVLSGAQASFGGDWQVIANEGICDSDTSEIEVITVEEEIQIGATNDGPACEGDSIQLTASFIPNATYSWESPTGDTLRIQNPKIEAQQGIYTLTVTTGSGCESITSTTVSIATRPTITALSSNASACVESGQDVQFFPSVFPDGNYDYIWTGPIALPNEKNPIISDVNASANGIYSLTVMNGTCESNTLTLTLAITETPDQATIIAPLQVCEGDSLILYLSGNHDSSIDYEWNTPQGTVISSTDSLIISNATLDSDGSYSVSLINGDCRSVVSEGQVVSIISRPTSPIIALEGQGCSGDSIRLIPDIFLPGASYLWSGPDGLVSADSIVLITNASDLNNGSYSLIITVDGCSSFSSNVLDILVESIPDTPVFHEAEYALCLADNDVIEVCVEASNYVSGQNYTLIINNQPITTTSDSCYLLSTTDLLLTEGSYSLQWLTNSGDCFSQESVSVDLILENEDPIEASIVADQSLICSGDIINLELLGLLGNEQIIWTSDNNSIIFSNETDNSTSVENLLAGSNTIYVNVLSGICNNTFSDSIILQVETLPEAIDDSYLLEYNQGEFLDILSNDVIERDFSFRIIQDVEFGTIEFLNGIIRFTSDERFIEEQIFIYELCYDDCPDQCTEAVVRLEVNIDLNCQVPSIITPNEDGINDALLITCLNADFFQNNNIIIFNQYGDEVYSAKPYLNDWQGTYNSEPLPVGTYYYVFDKGDGSKPLNGFIMIQR